jgi:quercetin 2,3-dioxygenase
MRENACEAETADSPAVPNLYLTLKHLFSYIEEDDMIRIRPSAERGHANYGWLDTHYSFSFANYYDPKHMGFRHLRVINEDFVSPLQGFGAHPHEDMEIITYIADGELSHRDSTGREATIRRDDVQRMSAGTGVVHSEYNNSDAPVHLLQIWILPEAEGLKASYEDRTFARAEKVDRLRLIASHDGRDSSTKINQDASVYASLLSDGKSVELPLGSGRHAWVQLISGELDVNGTRLKKGDGAAISDEGKLTIASVSGNGVAEFLLFDLA